MSSGSWAPDHPSLEYTAPPRPRGLRGMFKPPTFLDRRTVTFLLVIFIIVGLVFSLVFYEFLVNTHAAPPVPVTFTQAYMVGWNGTFNVTGISGGPYPWTQLNVTLTVNDFIGPQVPLAPSGQNASLAIGPDVYHVVWIDTDHTGMLSVGDVFWVTGDGVGLTPLTYIAFGLSGSGGAWTAHVYWETSSE